VLAEMAEALQRNSKAPKEIRCRCKSMSMSPTLSIEASVTATRTQRRGLTQDSQTLSLHSNTNYS
jgi:hypothetical protein